MHTCDKVYELGGTIRRLTGSSRIRRSLVLMPLLTLALTARGTEGIARSIDASGPAIVSLEAFERALARRDTRGAERAWLEAHVATLRGDWRAPLQIGDAALRLGLATGSRQVAVTRARQSYLVALFRARRARSSEGALQVAESFAALGDRDVVEQSLRVAERLLLPDDDATRARLQMLRAQVTPMSDPRATEVSLRAVPRAPEGPR